MSDEGAAPAAPTEGSGDAKPVETTIDPKAALNEALKKSGVKLKAKDREYVPRDIDDLTQRANRSFGLEQEIESFKKEKSEASQVKAWRAAIEADDEGAAEQAFELLSPKAQQNAAKWLQRKAQAWEESQKLPPEALRERERFEASQRELASYRQRDAETKQKAEQEAHMRELRGAQESVLKTATAVMGLFKADAAKSPRALSALTPFAARHMRAAMAAEEATGVPVDPQEIAANVHADVAQGFAAVAETMGDDALYESIGDALVKRLLRTHLLRVKGIKAAPPAPATNGVAKPSTNGAERGTPGFFR